MTKSTDSKNLKDLIQYILQSYQIDNLQLEADLFGSFMRYLHEKENGKTPAETRLGIVTEFKERADKVNALLAVARYGQDRIEYQHRVERAINLNPNWDDSKQDWNGFDLWLMEKEEAGQTIEKFMAWYKSDEFRAKGGLWLNPQKIKMFWPQAFERKTDEVRPEYKPFPQV